MKKLFFAISTLTLSACNVAPEQSTADGGQSAGCFASINRCDTRDTRKLDGTPYLHCETDPVQIMRDLENAGFTVESDFSFDGQMNGGGHHAVEPSTAHFKVAQDSVNCTVDGEGPYHCAHPRSVFIVPSAKIQEDSEVFAQMRSNALGLCIEAIR